MCKVVVPSVKFDRRRKYYMVLDCETATLPFAADYPADQKKTIAIAKPLIYDLGWTIIDKKGNVYAKRNFLITEIFSVPAIFDTAYYASKRPIYLDLLKKGEIQLVDWATASAYMVEDMSHVEAVGAYNSMFDYKKAIPFTECYIKHLYSPDCNDWMHSQSLRCAELASGHRRDKSTGFNKEVFTFRGVSYPLFDLWGLSCDHLLNNDDYKTACVRNGWKTESGKYFKTSAETTFRFVTGRVEFDEAHTALNDAEIESEIFAQIVRKAKNKVEIGIGYFPYRVLGTVSKFIMEHPELEDSAIGLGLGY